MVGVLIGLLDRLRPLPSDDREVIRRCLAGDRRAGRVLLERLLPVIHARVRRCLPRARWGEADDLVQDVWASLLADDGRALRTWEPDRGASLENYVGLITKRKVLNLIEFSTAARRGGGEEAMPLDDAAAFALPQRPSGGLADRDQLARLAAHLQATLPERGWLIFRLLFTDGCEVEEVAQALGVNAQVVYNWRFKIRQEARAWLEATGAAGS